MMEKLSNDNYVLMKICTMSYIDVVFFFQAEDGIRDDLVTGVQTCAHPILRVPFITRRQFGGEGWSGGEQERHEQAMVHLRTIPQRRSRNRSPACAPV